MGWTDVIKDTANKVVSEPLKRQVDTAVNVANDPDRMRRNIMTAGLSETSLGEGVTKYGDKTARDFKAMSDETGDKLKKISDKIGDAIAGGMGGAGGGDPQVAANVKAAQDSADAWKAELQKRLDNQRVVVAKTALPEQAMTPDNIARTVQSVNAGPAVSSIAGRVGTVNSPMVGEATFNVNDALGMSKSAAMGNEPSFAEALLKRNAENQIKQQMAAQGGRAYDAAANRNLANKAVEIGQAAGTEAAGVRAQEMAAARSEYANVATNNRAQMMQMSMADATNQLQALSTDQQAQVNQRAQNLQASGMNAENALKAAMADQNTQLQVEQQNAQLRQQANLANIESDLKAKGMTQDQINYYLSQITGLEQSKVGNALTAQNMQQQAAANAAANAQKREGALFGAGATVLASALG
jgi:hypothetical protein